MKSRIGCCLVASVTFALVAWTSGAAFASPFMDPLDPSGRYCDQGGDFKAQCIRTARDYGLTGNAIARTCQKATACSKDCIRTAWDYELRGELMVHACDDQPVEATAPCIRTGWHEGIKGDLLARMCRSVRTDVTDCIRTAVSAGLTVEEVVATCGGNTLIER